MHFIARLCEPHRVMELAHKAEPVGHFALATATAVHEWGNLVGFACLPVMAILLAHLLLPLFTHGD